MGFVQCWTLSCYADSSVPHMPYMRFLFVGPRVCLRLPSDSTSRWTPLPSANSSHCKACNGLSPSSLCTCRAHIKKGLRKFRKPLNTLSSGASVRIRTGDLRITSALLYQLSYAGIRRQWRSQRDSNSCRRLERAVSWASGRWDREMVSRSGLGPETPGLKVRCSTN